MSDQDHNESTSILENVLETLLSRAAEVQSHFPSCRRWLDRIYWLGESNRAAMQALEYAREVTEDPTLIVQYVDLAVLYDAAVQDSAAQVCSEFLAGEYSLSKEERETFEQRVSGWAD